jgi:hypothetical protein
MAEGSHKAVVELMGRVDSLEKATRTAQKEISKLTLELEKAQRSSTKASKGLDELDRSAQKQGKTWMQMRAGVLGYTGAIVGTFLAIDRLAERTLKLTGDTKGLAAAWVRMKESVISDTEEILSTVDKLGGIFGETFDAVRELTGSVDDNSKALTDGTSAIETYAYALGPLGILPYEAATALGALIDQAEALDGVIGKGDRSGLGNALVAGDADAFINAVLRATEYGKRLHEIAAAQRRVAGTGFLGGAAAGLGDASSKFKSPRGSRRSSAADKTFDAFEFTANDISELQGGEVGSRMEGEGDQSLSESAETFASRHVERERLKNDLVLEEKLRALEVEREMGVDPITQIESEKQALLEHNEFLLDTTSDDIARMALHDQRRQIVHEAQIKRIAAERAAERKKLADLQTWTSVSGQLLGMQTQTATMAAETFIKSDERRAKFVNRARGIEALGIGALQVVQAAAAAASFNIPQAILHSAAAAVAFTQGGLLISGALDQRAGGSAGRMPTMAGGGGMSSTGGGVGGGQRREGLVDQINSDVPPSPNPRAPTTASRKEQGRGGGVTINGPIHLYGTPEDEWLENLSNAQAKFARNNPEAA